jgi:solute carrier family 25 S-adenosylmethionine transporter 26
VHEIVVSGLAGGTAGVIVDVFYFPIETIKTRIQASSNRIDFTALGKDLSKYRGFSMQMLSSFPFAFAFWFTYEGVKSLLFSRKQSQEN